MARCFCCNLEPEVCKEARPLVPARVEELQSIVLADALEMLDGSILDRHSLAGCSLARRLRLSRLATPNESTRPVMLLYLCKRGRHKATHHLRCGGSFNQLRNVPGRKLPMHVLSLSTLSKRAYTRGSGAPLRLFHLESFHVGSIVQHHHQGTCACLNLSFRTVSRYSTL